MTEPTMQVPVSLIEQARTALADVGQADIAWALQEALSQPTPTAEPMREHVVQQFLALATCPDDRSRLDRLAQALDTARSVGMTFAHPTAEPTRIEDMAPGTTFTARQVGGHWLSLVRVVGGVVTRDEPNVLVPDIDPSTIRGVTPPKDDRG